MFITTDPKCENCGHAWSQHIRRDPQGVAHHTKCQVRKPKNWSEKYRAYRDWEPCICPNYRGQQPVRLEVTPATCPHEMPGDDGNRCVHCQRIVPKKSQKKQR